MAIPPGSTKTDFVSEKVSCAYDGNCYTVRSRIDYNKDVCLVMSDCGSYNDSRPCCVNCLSVLMKKYRLQYQSKFSD